jgi:hypothetical protein
MASPWRNLGVGSFLIAIGLNDLLTDQTGNYWRYFPTPGWVGWFAVPMGIGICILSIRAIQSDEGKPKTLTDEDLARAKEEMDRMYFAEHGVWPKKHGSLLEEIDHKKDA